MNALSKKTLCRHGFLPGAVLAVGLTLATIVGCTARHGSSAAAKRAQRPTDTLYTRQRAMDIYDYQPERALRIVDSAVIVGNLSPLQAEYVRAKIYAWTVMGTEVDSLLHGSRGVRFDSATVIGERLLEADSVKADLKMRQNVLEVLISATRQQKDTTRFLRHSRELVEVCHAQGAETEALRTEAEVGAALYAMGQREQGLARIDSVLNLLNSRDNQRFNELDATIIALKRKIVLFNSDGKFIETIPLAHHIINRLDDYEKHPAAYHDGTDREPADSTARADYIHFYRTQAQSAITAAYAFLGELGSMNEAYAQIEHSVREATAKEHLARYRALEQQMLRTKAENSRHLLAIVAYTLVAGMAVLFLFVLYVYLQKRKIQQKNRALVRQINEAMAYQEKYLAERESLQAGPTTDAEQPKADDDSTAELFSRMDSLVRTERLYADTNIQRQDLCDRFGIRREVLNRLLSDYADGASFPAYINSIRLSEACRLLKYDAEKTVNAIAEEVGLSPRNLRRLFVEQYGITPTEYRQGLQENS